MSFDRKTLEEQVAAGAQLKYLFFWGHSANGEKPGAWVLSQWWPGHPFTVDGVTYPTAEHWMMVGKAKAMGDLDRIEAILADDRPALAKKQGRQVVPWDQKKWEKKRFDIVVTGNREKFGQHPELTEFLLRTGDRILVEAAPRDVIWGIGLGKNNPNARDPRLWRGRNLLGFALMQVRAELQESRSHSV